MFGSFVIMLFFSLSVFFMLAISIFGVFTAIFIFNLSILSVFRFVIFMF